MKKGNGLQLQISNLESKAATSFEVALALAADQASQSKVLGKITIAGQETLMIPSHLNPAINKTVLLTNSSQRILATATLEPF